MIVTVGPTGRDYTSLVAAEAGEQQDLTTLADIVEFVCDAFEDPFGTTFDGWTTSTDYYVVIRAAAGAEATLPYTGSGYRLVGTANGLVIEGHLYTRVQDICIVTTSNASNRGAFRVGIGGGEIVERCVFVATDAAYSGDLVHSQGDSAQETVYTNCVGIIASTSGRGFVHQGGPGIGRFYNCTMIGGATGFARDFGSARAINCLASGFSSAGFASTWDSSSSNNATEDTTAPGSNSRQSQTFTFADAGAGDYRLAQTDVGARTYGLDLSGDATWPFSDDFDGSTRGATWDIGAHQVTSAAPPDPSGSTAGTSTASASAEKHGAGTSAGVSTASASGEKHGVGTSAGVSTAAASGEKQGSASSAGTGVASASGEKQGSASSAGVSTGTASGEKHASASTAGVGTATATAEETENTASAAGTSTASASAEKHGTAGVAGAGVASGAAEVLAAGGAAGTGVGTASGEKHARASAAGVGAASAVPEVTDYTASAAGVGAASASGEKQGSASATGTSSASAVPVQAASASAAGVSVVTASPWLLGAASAAGTSAASAAAVKLGSASAAGVSTTSATVLPPAAYQPGVKRASIVSVRRQASVPETARQASIVDVRRQANFVTE